MSSTFGFFYGNSFEVTPLKTFPPLLALRLLACFLFSACYLPCVAILNLLTLRIFTHSFASPLSRIWGRGCLFLLGVKLNIENKEIMDRREAKIVLFNHTSTLDLFVMGSLFAVGGTAIGKKQLAYIPFLNVAWWAMGFSFLDRENHEKGILQLNAFCEQMIQHRLTIMIAPEGTRSRTGELQKFKMGAFHMALKTKVPIVPMLIYNAGELMPYHHIFPHPGTIDIKLLPPLKTEDWCYENLREKTKEVREIYIKELQAYTEKRARENRPLSKPLVTF